MFASPHQQTSSGHGRVTLALILLTLAAPLASINGHQLRKCCPADQLLDHAEFGAAASPASCSPASDTSDLKLRPLFGHPLDAPPQPELPNCPGDSAQPERFAFEHILDAWRADAGDVCIDRQTVDGQIVGLRCPSAAEFSEPVGIHRLRKCCPDGQMYDLTSRQCSEVDSTSSIAPVFAAVADANAALLFSDVGVPKCDPKREVFVEFLSGSHTIRLQESAALVQWAGSDDYLPSGTFCVDAAVAAVADAQVIVRTCRPRAICERIPCVRRCCATDEVLERQNGSAVCSPYGQNISPEFHSVEGLLSEEGHVKGGEPQVVAVRDYALLNGMSCPRYILDDDYPSDAHFIGHRDGRLYMENSGPYGTEQYCIEFVNDTEQVKLSAFVCFAEYKQPKFMFYAVGLLVSTVFLWLTLIVYLSLPKLLNLHGKTLVCHVFSMVVAYMTLAAAQLKLEAFAQSCYILGYVIYFAFLASFCWQSVMCFDIWWTFGSMRTSRGMQKHKELRRFLLYSLYAWGFPTVMTVVATLCDVYDWLPDLWRPHIIADNRCWFRNTGPEFSYAQLLFFLLPIGLHILTNSVLFALTAHYCSKVKGEIHRMQAASDAQSTQRAKRRFLADRTKYSMTVKLFCVMGCSWLLEVVSTLVHQESIVWYFSDCFNILQGLLVFLIFVFKWKVWHALRQRLGFPAAGAAGSSGGGGGAGGSKQPTATTTTSNLSTGSNARLDRLAPGLGSSSTSVNRLPPAQLPQANHRPLMPSK